MNRATRCKVCACLRQFDHCALDGKIATAQSAVLATGTTRADHARPEFDTLDGIKARFRASVSLPMLVEALGGRRSPWRARRCIRRYRARSRRCLLFRFRDAIAVLNCHEIGLQFSCIGTVPPSPRRYEQRCMRSRVPQVSRKLSMNILFGAVQRDLEDVACPSQNLSEGRHTAYGLDAKKAMGKVCSGLRRLNFPLLA